MDLLGRTLNVHSVDGTKQEKVNKLWSEYTEISMLHETVEPPCNLEKL